jgi:DNA-binding transcriptional regulator YhcF (GntR family)
MLFARDATRASTPRGYNFTEDVRSTLARARLEAYQLRHGYVGTEHILLALIVLEERDIAIRTLRELGTEPEVVRRCLEQVALPGAKGVGKSDLPYTSRGKKVLEFAMTEARDMSHDHVGTEHLLLGIIREEKGLAAQVLKDLGASLDRARSIVLEELADDRERARPRPLLDIDDGSPQSIYEQIVVKIQEAIAMGRLRPGVRLPTVRRLADELDIAPGTVARAYSELERRRVIVTEGARGTRVADRQPSSLADHERPGTLTGLLRPVVVAAFHLGATAPEVRDALEHAMRGIFEENDSSRSET